MNWVLVGIFVYIALQFAIGAIVAKRISTESDYINAGRSLGLGLGAFSVFATWFGAEAIVGTAGQVYGNGLSGAEADPFGYAIALITAGLFFAAVLWRRGLVTFADFFRQRFGPGVEKLVVLTLLPGGVFWAAAQIRAFGQVFSSVSDINVTVAITIATVCVVAYTMLGGLLADAITDFVQGITIIIGLALLAWLAASQAGGFGASIASVPAERLAVAGGSWLEVAERYAVPICGTIVAVELVSRILGCRSAEVARKATVTGGLIYLSVGLIPVYLGLVGPGFVPGLEGAAAEQVVPEMAQKLMPNFLFVLFAGALISAILSTVDSVLLAAGSQVSHNLFVPMRPGADEAQKLAMVRATVAVLAIIAYGLALTASSIRSLVEVASAAGSTGIFVSLLFGLAGGFGGAWSAAAAIIVGTVSWATMHALELATAPYLTSLALAAATYVAVALVSRGVAQRNNAASHAPDA